MKTTIRTIVTATFALLGGQTAFSATNTCVEPPHPGQSSDRNTIAGYLDQAARNKLGTLGPKLILINYGPRPYVQNPPTIPQSIIKAIGWFESGWTQFKNGQTNMSTNGDCGYGIMQITYSKDSAGRYVIPSGISPARVASEEAYNVGAGAYWLVDKWNGITSIGSNDPSIYEHWYYAVWYFNGLGQENNPHNPAYDKFHPFPKYTGNRDHMPYQEAIWSLIRDPDGVVPKKSDNSRWWTTYQVQSPDYTLFTYDSAKKTYTPPNISWSGAVHVDEDLAPHLAITRSATLTPPGVSTSSGWSYPQNTLVAVTFIIKNVGTVSTELSDLVFGGRQQGQDCVALKTPCPDFIRDTTGTIVIPPGREILYSGKRKFDTQGHFSYSVYYRTIDGKWHWGAEASNNQPVNVVIGPPQTACNTSGSLSTASVESTDTSAATASCPSPVVPVISGLGLNPALPVAGQPFAVTMQGANFTPDLQVQFCSFGTTTCYTHPGSLTTVVSPTLVQLTQVNLGAGSWQAKARAGTTGQWSSLSSAFTVQSTTGTVRVVATLNGQPWSGSVRFLLLKDNSSQIDVFSGSAIPTTITRSVGLQTVTSISGAPGTVSSILPSSTQNLIGGSTVTFTLNFTSTTALSATCIVDPSQIYPGDRTTVTITAKDGSPPYSYSVDNGTYSMIANQTITAPATAAAGSRTVNVMVKDSKAAVSNGSCGYTVLAKTVGNYTLSAVSTVAQLQPGQTGGTVQLGMAYTNMLPNTTATMTVQGLPSGVTASADSKIISGSGNVYLSSNYTIGSAAQPGGYSPTASVTAAGITKTYALSLTIIAPRLSGSCLVNGQSSPLSLQVGNQATYVVNATGGTGTLHYVWSGISGNDSNAALQIYYNAGTYNVSVLLSDSAVNKQQVAVSCPTVSVAAPPPISAYCSFNPGVVSLGGGTTLTAGAIGGKSPYQFLMPGSGGYSSSNTQLIWPQQIGTATYQVTAKDGNGQTNTSSCAVQVQGVAPTLSGYFWNSQPKNRVYFSGSISGSGFVPGTQVWFCGNGSNTCYQQPASLVTINQLTSLTVTNVNLPTGYWQVYVATSYGTSSRSNAFYVAP